MARNKEIPELLEQYMEQFGETEQWITVQEFRTYFQLDEIYAPAISGFLRRIYHGPFFSCHYRVERMEKRMNHANLRLADVQRQLETNKTRYAERALDLYQQKLNLTKNTLADIPYNATGLLHAQEMTAKHEQILANLMLSHPDNTGLIRAHNNSLMLGQKFEEKNAIRLGRTSGQGNVTPPGTGPSPVRCGDQNS